MPSNIILVTGATGKQGGSVITALLSSPHFNPSTTKIYALTRSPTSSSALRLAAKSPSIGLIQGDLSNVPAIFKSLPSPPTSVFSVQLLGKEEVTQGKALIDSSISAGVSKFVYASVERGGDQRSWEDPTYVPHFTTKHKIEQYLIEKTKASGDRMSWTILRPVFFLDNLEWGFIGKIVVTAWRDHVPRTKPLQVISTSDIGQFGAAALLSSSTPQENKAYHNQAISLAGDELTFEDANKIFLEKTGQPIPTTFGFLATMVLWLMKDLGLMYRWFATEGFGSNIKKLRSMEAGKELKGFGEWVEGSQFSKSKK